MSKYLKMKFTGNAVLTPEYPDNLNAINGPAHAIMPGARQRRQSEFHGQQIDAQFIFVTFPYAQLVVAADNDRDADYKYPTVITADTGVCFLEEEAIVVETTSQSDTLTFVNGDTSSFPTVNSHETGRIARWTDFSHGAGALKDGIPETPGHYVLVTIPGGEISSGYVSNQIARIDMDYGDVSEAAPYAQEIVVSIPFDDSVTSVSLSCTPFPGSYAQPSFLTFIWGGRPSIDLLFGNGSMASLQSVLSGDVAGHDHQGDYDVEFDVLYDIIDCPADGNGRRPLPHIRSTEVLHVPCISSMIGQPGTGSVTKAPPTSVTNSSDGAQPKWQPRTLPTQRRKRSGK